MAAALDDALHAVYRQQCTAHGKAAADEALRVISRLHLDDLFDGCPAPPGAIAVIETIIPEATERKRREH